MITQSITPKCLMITLFIILMTLSVQVISYGQNMSVGEPRTVRMIYFLPNDRQYDAKVVQKMKDTIRTLQTFFAEQMQAHGHGNKTFQFETDAKGLPMVHLVNGQHSDSYYIANRGYAGEIGDRFDTRRGGNNIYFVVWDNSMNRVSESAAGSGYNHMKSGGGVLVHGNFGFGLAAHELGHAFGLGHDFRDGNYIMSYGPGDNQLSACAAEFLAVHPYFNPNISLEAGTPPTIELISPSTYPVGSKSVLIRLKVSDSEGLHQVLLSGNGLIACRGFTGEENAIVEFEYDGYDTPWRTIYHSLSNAISHYLYVEAVDKNADVSSLTVVLSEMTPYDFVTIKEEEMDTKYSSSLAFSPDGKKIAVAGSSIRLWEVATRNKIATFKGTDVAYSPKGKILATVVNTKVIKLWEIATQKEIAMLKGHTGNISSLTFSPNGKILASASRYGTIRLWEVATEREIGILKEHTDLIGSLAFSPDGKILASGTQEGTINLWEMATEREIGTLKENEGAVSSLAFSPDGELLASGMNNNWPHDKVKLWDVTKKQDIVTFPHDLGVTSVAFSPNGTILASASADGTVRLWHIEEGIVIAALPHTDVVRSVAFSPNGTHLASGTRGGVNLWLVESILLQQPIDTKKIFISEIMVASSERNLPQWIELYNRSYTQTVDLTGWTMEIQNYHTKDFNGDLNAKFTFKKTIIEPQETCLIVTKKARSSRYVGFQIFYNLNTLHPNLQDILLNEEGFYMKLRNTTGEVIDEVGNLDGKKNTNDKPAWSLPISMTIDGRRSSLIRRQDRGAPRSGTKASGWISAKNTKLATNTNGYYHYGHASDIGAPGVKSGGALPVQLSHFRAEHTDVGVILNWTTESEVDNAGFYIYRSETRNGEFVVVNTTMIQGAGTTGERNEYTWTDTTAKLNTVYYYRIEDVSHAGEREQLATVRLRGFISASEKLITGWGDLKTQTNTISK